MSSGEEIDKFESGAAGAALTVPIRAGEIKKGMMCILKDDKPCKVLEVTTSKTGKHGHAKAKIVGVDIFTGKKYIDVHPTSHNISAPVVQTSTYLLTDIEDDYCSLMTDDGEMLDETIPLPSVSDAATDEDKKLSEDIMAAFENGDEINLTVTRAMGCTLISGMKISLA